ncbi:hypothetical protein MJH54_30200, partial [Salmonella enterica subsp. enterica serovar Montevideo]|nr:hypothetical protein [Salmonella enterica subsp. enterica serovar Montevideo]
MLRQRELQSGVQQGRGFAVAGVCVFDAPFPLNDAFDALSWLASQSSFPQFYWQQRNGDEEAAVL